jgi:uncharacterized protein
MLTAFRCTSPLMRSRSLRLFAFLVLALGTCSGTSFAAERLEHAPSAFLRAHADSPVEWMPWGDAAFDRAAREGRPVFVAIGSASSELSAAMARQTFANRDVAAFLNERFVCVLVDREEHPAVAAQGQAYVRAVKQLSGWPLNLWLTPELQPFDGATYLPPSEEWGKEGFLNVAQRVAAAWSADPARVRDDAARAIETITELEAPPKPQRFRSSDVRTSLQGSAAAWRDQSDSTRGGFGEIPRHPEPEMLRFLLRGDSASSEAAVGNLKALLRSALRDPLDGGFFRYTADAEGKIPYFQKRTSDQARMVLALLEAREVTKDPIFAQATADALDYALARLSTPAGGFVTGEDATATGAASYYVWTHRELTQVLGAQTGAAFADAHGAQRDGNISREDDPSNSFLGQNILAGAPDPALREASLKLRAVRDKRLAPPRDETTTTFDQGLMLLALARAGHDLGESRFRVAAARAATFIERELTLERQALRRLAGSPAPAGPEDYAAVALGLRALGTDASRSLAQQLLRHADAQFLDTATGVLYTTAAQLPRGIWIRLPTPASGPGEPPAAAPLRLIAGDPFPEQLAALVATQHRDASLPASGDVLLALRDYVDRLP